MASGVTGGKSSKRCVSTVLMCHHDIGTLLPLFAKCLMKNVLRLLVVAERLTTGILLVIKLLYHGKYPASLFGIAPPAVTATAFCGNARMTRATK